MVLLVVIWSNVSAQKDTGCGVDLKYPEYGETAAHEFILGDLRDRNFVDRVIRFKGYLGNFYASVPQQYHQCFDEIYQFAADMGGAGFVFTGENDADIMHNSVSINLNVLEAQKEFNDYTVTNTTKIFYSGSACMYPEHNQLDPNNPDCREESAYPANPDSEYGWENSSAKDLYFAYNKNHSIPVRVARYHNIFGPEGTWEEEERESSRNLPQGRLPPETKGGGIEVWGDGVTNSFLPVH